MKDLTVKDAEFEGKALYNRDYSGVPLNFYTTYIDQAKHAELSHGYPPYTYYIRLNNGKFKGQEK